MRTLRSLVVAPVSHGKSSSRSREEDDGAGIRGRTGKRKNTPPCEIADKNARANH